MRPIAWLGLMLAALATICPARALRRAAPRFRGYRVCSGPGGYSSTEWSRDGMRFGQDSDGDRWSTSRWQGSETTTVWPRPER